MALQDILQEGKINFLIDAYYGSSAKAISSAYITKKWLDRHTDEKIALITINGASSSHTYKLNKDSEPFVFKALPSGAGLNREEKYKDRIIVFVAPSAIIDPEVLKKEIDYCQLKPEQVIVSKTASVLDPDIHPKEEAMLQGNKNHLGSTQSGQSASYVSKISRNVKYLFVNHQSKKWTTLGYPDFPKAITDPDKNLTCLVEIPQGFPLSIDYTPEISKSTFRNLNPLQVMSDIGVNRHLMGYTIANFRALPIRVSNRFDERMVTMLVARDNSDPTQFKKVTPKSLGWGYNEINALIQPIYDLEEGQLLSVNSRGWIIDPDSYLGEDVIKIRSIHGIEGTSGKFHSDMEEISWSQLSDELGCELLEKTTLTKLPRRIAKIKGNLPLSQEIIDQLILTISPDKAIVTFANYWGDDKYEKVELAYTQLMSQGIELVAYQDGDSVEDVHLPITGGEIV